MTCPKSSLAKTQARDSNSGCPSTHIIEEAFVFLVSWEASVATESTPHLLKVLPSPALSPEMKRNFMHSEVTWGEASLLLTCLCGVLQPHRWLHLEDTRVGKDHVLLRETGSLLAQDQGHAGRKAVAVISGVKLPASRLAPSGLLWPPPPRCLATQSPAPCVCKGRWGRGHGWSQARVVAPVWKSRHT